MPAILRMVGSSVTAVWSGLVSTGVRKSLCSRVPEVRFRPSETTLTTSVVRRGSVSTRATLTGVTEVQEAGSTVAEGVAPGVAGLAVPLLVVLGDAVSGLAAVSEADGDAGSGAVVDVSASVSAGDGSGFGTSPLAGAGAQCEDAQCDHQDRYSPDPLHGCSVGPALRVDATAIVFVRPLDPAVVNPRVRNDHAQPLELLIVQQARSSPRRVLRRDHRRSHGDQLRLSDHHGDTDPRPYRRGFRPRSGGGPRRRRGIQFPQALLRGLAFWTVDFAPWTGFCGGLFCSAVNPMSKRFGDLMAGTIVIRPGHPRHQHRSRRCRPRWSVGGPARTERTAR